MKSIMAGGGNIHCSIGGHQWPCEGDGDLLSCTDVCADMADAMGAVCEGCAQFPVMGD